MYSYKLNGKLSCILNVNFLKGISVLSSFRDDIILIVVQISVPNLSRNFSTFGFLKESSSKQKSHKKFKLTYVSLFVDSINFE